MKQKPLNECHPLLLTCTMAAAGPSHVSAVTYARNNKPKDIVGVGAINTPSIQGAASNYKEIIIIIIIARAVLVIAIT